MDMQVVIPDAEGPSGWVSGHRLTAWNHERSGPSSPQFVSRWSGRCVIIRKVPVQRFGEALAETQ